MALDAALSALAQSFQIAVDASGAADRRFVATLVSPGGREGLKVTDLVTKTEIIPAAIDLGWRTKDVRFATTDITDPVIVGGMPINDLLALQVGNVTTGPTAPPGVPGLVGALAGTVPLPIEVTTPTDFDVAVDVRWKVVDADGSTINDLSWSLAGSPAESGLGGDITPTFGRALDALTIVFDLAFVELTIHTAENPTVQRAIRASIRLLAGGVSSDWVDLPEVPLTLPAIPVPTIAILCRHKNFGGQRLVVVPADSKLDEATIQAAVTTLHDKLEPLRGTFTFLGLFIDEATTVSTLLASGTFKFRKTDAIPNLNDIDLDSGFFNDIEAEDELSSMILVGAPRRRIECFNKRDFGTGQGQLDLTAGIELIALVNDLHSASPTSNPVGRVSVPHGPAGTRWSGLDPWRDITAFGDEFSSLRFAWSG